MVTAVLPAVWVGFAAAILFITVSFAAAAVYVLETFDDVEERLRLDDLWDDGVEPSWLIRARAEIRDLPEVTA